jgi:hypothetical protein
MAAQDDGITSDTEGVTHEQFVEYHMALQTEALMRLYDTNLVLLTRLTGDRTLADGIVEMHASGRFYFPPPGIDPQS